MRLLLAILLLASSATAQEGFPKFSWDHVPVYAHVGLGKGLTDEQYRFLAEHFDFLAFTGGDMDRDYRNNDALSFETVFTGAAAKIKARNPKAKILFYLAADFAKPQLKISNAMIPADGRLKVVRNAKSTVEVFDTTNPATRDWWTDIAARSVREYGGSGIFVDGGTAFRPGTIYDQKLGKEKVEALDRGMFEMIRQAKAKMGPGRLALVNPLHGFQGGEPIDAALGWRYLSVFDGAMIDDFDRMADNRERQSPEYIANTITVMSRAAKDGKIVIFKAWPGFTWRSQEIMKQPPAERTRIAVQNLEFNLACFLVGAGEHSYFCYTWGWMPEHGAFEWYPEFNKPLGKPNADATRNGWAFHREFEHASVRVDIEKRSAKIDWN